MGEETCRDCGKWEEDMYWTHFQSIMFCQFLSLGFHQQLAIPKKFANNLKQKLPENATLIGPSGAKWNVKLVPSGDTVFFKHGWKDFVEDNSLKEDDVLIFRYSGDSRFDVLIFNGKSLCEREASYFVKKCGHTELDGGLRTKRIMGESSVENGHDSSDNAVGCTSSKRPRKDESPKPVRSGRRPQARIRTGANHTRPRNGKHEVAQQINSVARNGAVGAYPLQYVSNRRPVTEEEKEKAIQMAHAASTKDSFVVVMRASHVYKGFYMSIPSEWALSRFPRKSQDVILRVKEKEKTWQVRYVFKVRSGGLNGAWKNFAFENNLEESDACLFELDSGTTDSATIVMDVSIFRVVAEVNPLTRVTRLARRGRPARFPRRK